MNSTNKGSIEQPTNLGTDVEKTIKQWAEVVVDIVDEVLQEAGVDTSKRKRSQIIHVEALADDPPRRRADNSKAKTELGWQPRWKIEDGIRETARYFYGLTL